MEICSVQQTVEKILNYYDNTRLFKSVTKGGTRPKVDFVPSTLTIDIHNRKDYKEQGITFHIPNLEFAYQVLSKVTGLSVEICKTDAQVLFENNRTDINKELFMTAFLAP